jgi:hypothetical protein
MSEGGRKRPRTVVPGAWRLGAQGIRHVQAQSIVRSTD